MERARASVDDGATRLLVSRSQVERDELALLVPRVADVTFVREDESLGLKGELAGLLGDDIEEDGDVVSLEERVAPRRCNDHHARLKGLTGDAAAGAVV